MPAARIFLQLIADFIVYLGLFIRPRKAIAAENLFLRRQLALYQSAKWPAANRSRDAHYVGFALKVIQLARCARQSFSFFADHRYKFTGGPPIYLASSPR
jgi:hypothetical protein